MTQAWQVGTDHSGNDWVAADRLTIGQKNDGLAITWNLNRAWGNRVRDDVGTKLRIVIQARSFEP